MAAPPTASAAGAGEHHGLRRPRDEGADAAPQRLDVDALLVAQVRQRRRQRALRAAAAVARALTPLIPPLLRRAVRGV